MADSREAVIKMYDGALRALDTKAQIFLAFLTVTMTPVFTRLHELGLPLWARGAESLLFVGATAAFVYCLFPRRGRRSAQGLFDTELKGAEVTGLLAKSSYELDASAPITALHDIYRIKARAVTVGIVLIAVHIVTVAVTLALA
jgi:hypothetical protein